MPSLERIYLLPQSQHIHIFIANKHRMILEVTVSQRGIVGWFFDCKEIIFSWKISKGAHYGVLHTRWLVSCCKNTLV